MSYAEYYKAKLDGALVFQDFVVDVAWQTMGLAIVQYSSKLYQAKVGESRTGVEIKHDEKFKETENLWIEVAEKARPRHGDYVPSGIFRNDNAWLYAIGDYDTIFFFSKKFLRQLAESGRVRIFPNHTKTSRGFLLCKADALKYAMIVLLPKAADKISKLATDLSEEGRQLHSIVKALPGQGVLFNLHEQ
jgi:hypothetical protein